MSDHGDFVDDYIAYRIFEESMKRSGGGKMSKRNSGGAVGAAHGHSLL